MTTSDSEVQFANALLLIDFTDGGMDTLNNELQLQKDSIDIALKVDVNSISFNDLQSLKALFPILITDVIEIFLNKSQPLKALLFITFTGSEIFISIKL
ncbi:hypothetical protein M9Y10_014529 [Tritrichomonas musculus]|uniref:Uncharacterized protein n=1 Tax=Tritrichomonas musculus TaxID=1915356 RepID=A0ABR2KZS4_9EUKA